MKKVLSLVMVLLTISALFMSSFSGMSKSYMLGDVNGDGKISAKDSLLIKCEVAGISPDIIRDAADIDADGDITLRDVLLIKKHLARLITIDNRPITDNYLSDITLDGVSLSMYKVVLPEYATVYETYAAELLCDYVTDKSGITMPIVSDSDGVFEYEFLIGQTNRPESIEALQNLSPSGLEYVLKADGAKVVMLGDEFMIGAPVGAFTYDYIVYDPEVKNAVCNIDSLPEEDTVSVYEPTEAKSAILMIGDGMGMTHIPATLEYNAKKRVEPDYTEFTATKMPYIAQLMTASLDTYMSGGTTPTDSAAAGTALACGVKTRNHYLGMDPAGKEKMNIRELAVSLGKRNAVLSTEPKEGATPSAFTVHIDERAEIEAIAEAQALITDCDYLKGSIEDELLPEVKYTLDLLSTNNENGFFTMIEEAKTDTYSHNHDPEMLIHCMNRFNKAIQYALVFTASHPDTLLIVTADHETGGVKPDLSFTSNGHTPANVYCFAMGPGAEAVSGTFDNILIPKIITSGWGVNFPG